MPKGTEDLPVENATASWGEGKGSTSGRVLVGLGVVLLTGAFLALTPRSHIAASRHLRFSALDVNSFFNDVKFHDSASDEICPGAYGKATSYSGYIGLKDDKPDDPRRSFFWLFEAQNGDPNAPVILTTGGGPGTSGLLNPLTGQSHCAITANGTVANPHAWTEHFNLLALDHPIGAGFSYGRRVDNSRDAGLDAYDFLQKFYVLFPHLLKNSLVLASGSFGGTYIPNIATAIHEGNLAIASGQGYLGARHINLESMMLSNPYSDAQSHWRWALQQRCYYTDIFNSSTCEKMYEQLPFCLEAIQVAYQDPTIENRVTAMELCWKTQLEVVPGRPYENVEQRCNGTIVECIAQAGWLTDFLNDPNTKAKLGVPAHLNFTTVNIDVNQEFVYAGDLMLPVYKLYEPLLKAGIRLLHYIGKLDANCGWPGIFSFLKLIRSQYQAEFLAAPDLRMRNFNASVRAIGPGAGDFTYILMDQAGHLVVRDQPILVKSILEHWLRNEPFEVEEAIF